MKTKILLVEDSYRLTADSTPSHRLVVMLELIERDLVVITNESSSCKPELELLVGFNMLVY